MLYPRRSWWRWPPPFLRSVRASLNYISTYFCWGAWVNWTMIIQKYECQCYCTNPWGLPIKPCISHVDNISLLHENLKLDTSKPSINIVEVTLNCFLHCRLVHHEDWGAGTTSHMEPSDILNLCGIAYGHQLLHWVLQLFFSVGAWWVSPTLIIHKYEFQWYLLHKWLNQPKLPIKKRGDTIQWCFEAP